MILCNRFDNFTKIKQIFLRLLTHINNQKVVNNRNFLEKMLWSTMFLSKYDRIIKITSYYKKNTYKLKSYSVPFWTMKKCTDNIDRNIPKFFNIDQNIKFIIRRLYILTFKYFGHIFDCFITTIHHSSFIIIW